MAKMKFASSKPINKGQGKGNRERYNYNASVVPNANQHGPKTGYGKTVFGARQGGKC